MYDIVFQEVNVGKSSIAWMIDTPAVNGKDALDVIHAFFYEHPTSKYRLLLSSLEHDRQYLLEAHTYIEFCDAVHTLFLKGTENLNIISFDKAHDCHTVVATFPPVVSAIFDQNVKVKRVA